MNEGLGRTVVVGLSGGVDSSVSALLLKQAGYNVIGVFMRNWTDSSVLIGEDCPWIEDSNDAMLVADKIGIPFQVLDLSNEYKKRIVDYMFAEYEAGRTPNPDVLCNREIKFDVFLKAAKMLGAEFVATGHYCRKGHTVNEKGEAYYTLLSGADPNKDQSYFLCQITQEQLSQILFPIGHLQKSEVRAIATEYELVTASKKDSQGLCFIGKVSLPDFLQQKLKTKEGNVVEIEPNSPVFSSFTNQIPIQEENKETYLQYISSRWKFKPEDGKVIGKHIGAHFYTIGQRKGLNIGGKPLPLFVLAIDTESNTVYVGQGEKHPGLHGTALKIQASEISFIRTDLQPEIGQEIEVSARIRYRQPLFKAKLYRGQNDYFLYFNSPKSAIAPGQFAAFYIGEECIGSGTIAP
jgi:tRNA-uridine 2-sulfurtransferase